MKKRILAFLFASLMVFLLACPAVHADNTDSASELSYDPNYYNDGIRVIDQAARFSPYTIDDLRQRIAAIQSKYQTDVVILTVPSLDTEELRHYHYRDIRSFAEDYYDYLGYGLGPDHDGLILVINMALYGDENREYCIVTSGKEIDRFQKHMNMMYDRIYSKLSNLDYDGAADTFLSLIETKYKYGFYPPTFGKILISLAIGCLAGAMVVGVMKSKMNTVKVATQAHDYVVPGSFQLRNYQEILLHTAITRTERPQMNDRGGGGGGGISIGSSGVSHGGGGGHGF
ncbi:MAG: TPM domain-containing protein [Lachnospiraceae bacterium]|nr:TPM domain-containing protein [Lachnospiraceae bacterium]